MFKFDWYTLRSICIKYDFFTCGSMTQYEKLNEYNEKIQEPQNYIKSLSLIIWICSKKDYTLEQIDTILINEWREIYDNIND